MGQRTITTTPVLSGIRIEAPVVAGQDPRVWVEGQVQDEQGRVVESVTKNVYPEFTVTQKARVDDIIAYGKRVIAIAAGD